MKVPTPAPVVRCFIRDGQGVTKVSAEAAAEKLRSLLDAGETKSSEVVWIDLCHPSDAEARYLRDAVGMHPLAVEDCMRGRQRPKLDRYPGYFFVVFYATRINPARARMALNEIHVFLGTNFLITVHDQEIAEVSSLIDLWRENPNRWPQSAAVAHGLLDAITDSYFPLIEYFSTKIEAFEDEIFTESPDVPLQRVALLRQELIHFRRILSPERDVLSSFLRRDLPFVSPDLVPYFQDVHDHVLRATEEIDAFRDLLAGLLEIQASNSAKQLNQTMQTLTAWSIILMSMTLIAGVYGMNFDQMPELSLPWGYYAALALMAGVGIALVSFFRRRHWL